MSVSPRPLSSRQARFVAEYLLDLSPENAALRAGYSHRTAPETGRRLM